MLIQEHKDEILEIVWVCKEKETQTRERVLELMQADSIDEKLYHDLIEEGFIREEEGKPLLTETGEVRARRIIRQHRLAETLMFNVLGMDKYQIEQSACAFEHSLVPEVTEGICTLLGHPSVCPHGKAIPPGDCCDRTQEHVITEMIVPLTKIRPGQEVKVCYLNSPQEKRLHYLTSVGINPGSLIKLHQVAPSIVIECQNTQIAMEHKVAEDIFVWKK